MLIEVRFQKSGEQILSAGSLEFLDEGGATLSASLLSYSISFNWILMVNLVLLVSLALPGIHQA